MEQQTSDPAWAHDYALQFINRLMFLYFIQRKRWLGDNHDFIYGFWEAYKSNGQPKDTFFDQWLSVLFFEAFNERFQAGRVDRQHFPPEIREAFAKAPFLNGGLFTPNDLDDKQSFRINDTMFKMLFDRFNGQSTGFLEHYNFTITEDTPFDQEVAVDPEMIGKVYESLVNITFEGIEEEDRRGTAGIFYTPRIEIDLMCRLSLVDWLANRLGDKHKSVLYEAVFAYDPDEKETADRSLTKENLWSQLNDLLREATICDPACGSGSFLVGMLTALDDLQARANNQLGIDETAYERRKRIIGQSLYGVDVMPWAVHVAELRLWLQLVVETELKLAELKFRPLLPNLSFKIRQGDSLVQEIGGISFALHKAHLDISPELKGRLTKLKGRKLHFYNAEDRSLSEVILRKEEVQLFRDILSFKIHSLQQDIVRLTKQIETPPEQLALAGMEAGKAEQMDLMIREWERDRERKKNEATKVRQALGALTDDSTPFFVWDVAFVEIFEGEKDGFDIVLGNPPYVRQEKIAPPDEKEEDHSEAAWRQLKKEYKAKLQESVAQIYPRFFKSRKLDGKSDYYVYFYLHGMSLLNRNGSFCFITSNSWLDVGYGKDLQEFLAKHSQIKYIIDNQMKRSFSDAGINTIIVLFSAPDDTKAFAHDHTARFIMFKTSFEEILHPVIFEEIDDAAHRSTKPGYRVLPINQEELFKGGLDVKMSTDKDTLSPDKKSERTASSPLIKVARYIGDKWGGKYLRAPDIYWRIISKKDKLGRLCNVSSVYYGIKTGANDFFYLRGAQIQRWEIEKEFLKPVIKSPTECKQILINPKDLKYKVFWCNKDKKKLKGTAAFEYIRWGEKQGFNDNPSCSGRSLWWVLPRGSGNSIFVKEANDTAAVFYNPDNYLVDCRLYYADLASVQLVYLNSIIAAMMYEIYNRAALGEGARSLMVSDYAQVPIIEPSSDIDNASIESVFRDIHSMPARKVTTIPDECWRNIDQVIFDILQLDQAEREAVYEAALGLVNNRLEKAQSI
ncbi:MAG: Eco57I restriction-modification methylase domain-containing protein [Fidelibacterota bacterium]|nr:MAG: Eco57I restriction-modification methylase domain-containing protein [Candidatus Neomarinimicrobiota bacterium]